MRSRLGFGLAIGLVLSTLGPIMADVSEQSGNHPEPQPGTTWVKTEERHAGHASIHAKAPNGDHYGYVVWVWSRETTLASNEPAGKREGRIQFWRGIRRNDGGQEESLWTGSVGGRNDVRAPAPGQLALSATLVHEDGSTCDIHIEWNGAAGLQSGYTSVNAVELESQNVRAVAIGSCLGGPSTAEGSYGHVWHWFDRRSSGDVVSDDRLGRGAIITVAGVGRQGAPENDIPARWSFVTYPDQVAGGPDGSVFIGHHGLIRRVNPDGIITTLATARPRGMTVGPDGSVFASVRDEVIRISPSGEQTVILGPSLGQSDGSEPGGLAVDATGRVLVADVRANRVRRIDSNGTISTVAGDGSCQNSADGLPATLTSVCEPSEVAVAEDGTLYIVAESGTRVQAVSPDGQIRTLMGKPPTMYGLSYNGHGDTSWSAMAVGPDQKVYLATWSGWIVRVDAPHRVVPVSGLGFTALDGGPALTTGLVTPEGIDFDADGNLLIAETWAHRVRLADVGAAAR